MILDSSGIENHKTMHIAKKNSCVKPVFYFVCGENYASLNKGTVMLQIPEKACLPIIVNCLVLRYAFVVIKSAAIPDPLIVCDTCKGKQAILCFLSFCFTVSLRDVIEIMVNYLIQAKLIHHTKDTHNQKVFK